MWTIIIQVVGAYMATLTAALTLELPRVLLPKVGVVGAAGWLLYLISLPYMSSVYATLLGCILIAVLSQLFARVFKGPVTMFLIPSYFPFVPGIGIYKTAYYTIQQEPQIAANFFFQTLLTAGAIGLSVYIVDSVIEIIYSVRGKMKNN